MSSFEFIGIDRLVDRLRSLPKQVAGPIAVKAMRAGGEVAVTAIRQRSNAYVAKSIKFRFMKRSSPYALYGVVGANVIRSNDNSQWAPIQISGSRERFRKTRTGKLASTGRIIGTNAVALGVNASRGQVAATMQRVIKQELEKLNK